MNEQEKLKSFKKDLDELLKNHNATLRAWMKGDTYGIIDSGIDVSFHYPDPSGRRKYVTTNCFRLNND